MVEDAETTRRDRRASAPGLSVPLLGDIGSPDDAPPRKDVDPLRKLVQAMRDELESVRAEVVKLDADLVTVRRVARQEAEHAKSVRSERLRDHEDAIRSLLARVAALEAKAKEATHASH